jgi:hypothetical protein
MQLTKLENKLLAFASLPEYSYAEEIMDIIEKINDPQKIYKVYRQFVETHGFCFHLFVFFAFKDIFENIKKEAIRDMISDITLENYNVKFNDDKIKKMTNKDLINLAVIFKEVIQKEKEKTNDMFLKIIGITEMLVMISAFVKFKQRC